MSLKKFLCTIGIGFKVCSIVNAAAVAANGAVCGVDFVIAERGAPPNCSIVVDGNAGELERYATLQSAAADFIARTDEVKKAKKGDIYLSEGGARSRWLMGDFRSLAAWRPHIGLSVRVLGAVVAH